MLIFTGRGPPSTAASCIYLLYARNGYVGLLPIGSFAPPASRSGAGRGSMGEKHLSPSENAGLDRNSVEREVPSDAWTRVENGSETVIARR